MAWQEHPRLPSVPPSLLSKSALTSSPWHTQTALFVNHLCVRRREWLARGFARAKQNGKPAIDVPPPLSSTAIWSPIPNDKEIGREEAFYRRADHRLPA